MEPGRIPDRHRRTYPVNSTTQPPACGASTQKPPPGAGAGATRPGATASRARRRSATRTANPARHGACGTCDPGKRSANASGDSSRIQHRPSAIVPACRGPGSGYDGQPAPDLARLGRDDVDPLQRHGAVRMGLDLALVYQPRRLVPDEAQQTLGRDCGLEHEPLESGFPVPRAVLDGAARAGRSPHGHSRGCAAFVSRRDVVDTERQDVQPEMPPHPGRQVMIARRAVDLCQLDIAGLEHHVRARLSDGQALRRSSVRSAAAGAAPSGQSRAPGSERPGHRVPALPARRGRGLRRRSSLLLYSWA